MKSVRVSANLPLFSSSSGTMPGKKPMPVLFCFLSSSKAPKRLTSYSFYISLSKSQRRASRLIEELRRSIAAATELVLLRLNMYITMTSTMIRGISVTSKMTNISVKLSFSSLSFYKFWFSDSSLFIVSKSSLLSREVLGSKELFGSTGSFSSSVSSSVGSSVGSVSVKVPHLYRQNPSAEMSPFSAF